MANTSRCNKIGMCKCIYWHTRPTEVDSIPNTEHSPLNKQRYMDQCFIKLLGWNWRFRQTFFASFLVYFYLDSFGNFSFSFFLNVTGCRWLKLGYNSIESWYLFEHNILSFLYFRFCALIFLLSSFCMRSSSLLKINGRSTKSMHNIIKRLLVLFSSFSYH